MTNTEIKKTPVKEILAEIEKRMTEFEGVESCFREGGLGVVHMKQEAVVAWAVLDALHSYIGDTWHDD